MGGAFDEWVAALEARHLANLRVPEVTRALRALSSAYVERRRRTATPHGGRANVHGALDSAGKRAAFALFYAPLHFIAVTEVIRAHGDGTRGAEDDRRSRMRYGRGRCRVGTGVPSRRRRSSASIATRGRSMRRGGRISSSGSMDAPVRGTSRDCRRLAAARRVVAAYVLNELPDTVRITVEKRLLETVERGGRVLVIEPIARGIAPWWDDMAARFAAFGGRADEWRLPIDLPPLLQKFDRAAGLNHRELTFRSLFA